MIGQTVQSLPLPQDTETRNLASVVETMARGRMVKKGLKAGLALAGLAHGAWMTYEAGKDRQRIQDLRKDNEKLYENQRTLFAFVNTLINETEVGAEAYLHLQLDDESDDSQVTDWADQHDTPESVEEPQ
jgi:hypothetical protein